MGANFVRYLVRGSVDYQITVLDALTYASDPSRLSSAADQITFVQGDVCDGPLVDKLVGGADVVVHFAAESHVDNSIRGPLPFVQSNIIGTFTVLEAVRRHDVRLHHISTDEVYGDLTLDPSERFTETAPYAPSSPYSATKASSDMLVRAWIRSYGIAATVSNSTNNYGPYQHVEKFIPRQLTSVLVGSRPKIYGSGVNVREWTHVDDHSAAVCQILVNGRLGETYLIGSGEERSNMEVMQAILGLMDHPFDAYDRVADRPGHDLRYAVDSSKIRAELGWYPRHSDFEAGLAETIGWYRRNQGWWRRLKGSN